MSDFHPSYLQMKGVGPVPYSDGTLVAFKAGKMHLADKKLKSDPRRGLIKVVKDSDELVHLQWFERDASSNPTKPPEDDLVVFPGEAVFKKVGATTQRVYVLQFSEDSSRDQFFWLQESVTDTDAELCRQLNQALNNPDELIAEKANTAVNDRRREVSTSGEGGSEAAGGSGSTPSAAQLAQMLSAISQANAAQAQGVDPTRQAAMAAAALLASACGAAPQRRPVGPSLAEILKPEVMVQFLMDPDMLDKLSSYLPEEHRSQEALLALAQSPQFQQQLQTFSMALQTGQLDLATLGLQVDGFSVVDFLAGVQDLVEKERKEKGSN